MSTAHKLYGESICLLKTVLGFFIKPQIIIQHSDDLTKLRFTDPSAHLPDDEIYIGDSTSALLVHLQENECELIDGFYQSAVRSYQNLYIFLRDLVFYSER